MQLKAERLSSHLSGPLAPVYVVGGDEPLLVLEAADAIRARARERGFVERTVLEVDASFDWDALAAMGQSPSLFADRRVADLRMPGGKPGDAGAKALAAWAGAPDPSTLLLVTTGPLDGRARRSRWYRALEGAGAAIQCWPVSTAELPGWIRRRAEAAGIAGSAAAWAELAERVEGNLLACAQAIDKLRLLYDAGPVDVDEIVAATSDEARYGTFDLVDYTLDGNAARALRVLERLRAEDQSPLLVTGTLAWQLRTAASIAFGRARGATLEQSLRRHPTWNRRRAGLARALDRLPPEAWAGLLVRLGRVDRMVKGAEPGDPWAELEAVCLEICGVSLAPPGARAV